MLKSEETNLIINGKNKKGYNKLFLNFLIRNKNTNA
jgi:hypothetical protein